MIDIRPILSSQRDEILALIPEGKVEPHWDSARAIWHNGEIVGVLGVLQRWVLEPLYVKPGHATAFIAAGQWADGAFTALGAQQYEFFVSDDFPKTQNFIKAHFDVEFGEEKPGFKFVRHLRKVRRWFRRAFGGHRGSGEVYLRRLS